MSETKTDKTLAERFELGGECLLVDAMLEDSLGGVDESRVEYAVANCECKTCQSPAANIK